MNKNNEKEITKLKELIKGKNLKYTKQREVILNTILDSSKHLNVEDLYFVISKKYPNLNIGIATIYRNLSFLEEHNLVSSISINDGYKIFESSSKKHHDHIVCSECGKIVEFLNNELEKLQEDIAKKNGFKLVDHTMYLYGLCADCK